MGFLNVIAAVGGFTGVMTKIFSKFGNQFSNKWVNKSMVSNLYLTKKTKRPKFDDFLEADPVVKFPKIKFNTH